MSYYTLSQKIFFTPFNARNQGWAVLAIFIFFIIPNIISAHGDHSEVAERLSCKIEENSSSALLYFERGLLYQEHGFESEALSDFYAALRLEPDFDVCYLRLSQVYLELGSMEKSLYYVNLFINEKSDNPFAYGTRAEIYQIMGKDISALSDFRQVIELKNDHSILPDDYLNLSAAVLSTFPSELEWAVEVLKEGLDRLGNNVIVLQSKLIDLQLERYQCDEALHYVDQILSTLSRKEKWLLKKAEILQFDGRIEEANQILQQVNSGIRYSNISGSNRLNNVSGQLRSSINDFSTVNSSLMVTVSRGPYLQMGTSSSMVIKWRTDLPANSQVWYGDNPDNLSELITLPGNRIDHEIVITELEPNTKYYYAIGHLGGILAGETENYFFKTSPSEGSFKPFRAWILGDSGTKDDKARSVRDGYYNYAAGEDTDLILMLGDNAYDDGKDDEYQTAVFENMYEEKLIHSVLWPTPGNHDYVSANASDQTGPYFDIFSLPKNAEAGGLASGTEAYYSFDYGNVHFVSLDSHDSGNQPGDPMLVWLENDLSATDQDWVVVFFHHPPYSKGSHNSDKEDKLKDMRENVLPIIEAAGVDLVLSGHSHSYERSYLLNGHYGKSGTLDDSMIMDSGNGRLDGDGPYMKSASDPNSRGAVYVVGGSSGKASSGKLDHPVMYYSDATLGSLSMEVSTKYINLNFIGVNGDVIDYFTLTKQDIVQTASICSRVSASKDDAEERSDGSVALGSGDLELINDGAEQIVGLRFSNLNIPQGSKILNAQLQFTTDENKNENPCELFIFGEASDNSLPFASSTNNISSRSRTNTSISWTPPEWTKRGDATQDQQTPDISLVIQEIVNQNGYTQNSAIALIIDGIGKRVAKAFNSSSAQAPQLCIDYEIPDCPELNANIGDACNDGNPCTINDRIRFDCLCKGTYKDSDNDGVCDPQDICNGVPEPGTPCDDGNPNTTGETIQPDCVCKYVPTITNCVRIENGTDDAEEKASGNVSLVSADIELVEDGSSQMIGLRFNNLGIPPGVWIRDAQIQFTVDEKVNVDPCNLQIFGEASDNAITFIASKNNISDRQPTEASILWSPSEWNSVGEAGENQQTPNISSVLQEIVNRNGYTSNSSIAIMISGEGKRIAEAFEGSSAKAAQLCVTYVPLLDCPELWANIGGPCDDNDPCTINDIVLADCNCEGEFSDTDGDSICDGLDNCEGPEPGTPCNDGDPCTTDDILQPDCSCAGTFQDSDVDGICDAEDICNGGPEPGMYCDDGNPNTSGETVQADCSCQPPSSMISCSRVSSSNEDAEENASGNVILASSDLELTADATEQTIGLCFSYLDLPPGAQIINAHIQFTVDEIKNIDPCNLTIYGEANENAIAFTNASNNISSRPLTNASVQWSPPQWLSVGEAGPDQLTPDISSVVQEIVNQNEYKSNSPVVIILKGEGKRVAESFNGNNANAPELCIEYTLSFDCEDIWANIGGPCDDGDPCTSGDVVQLDCSCSGIYTDSDGDGTCEGEDLCPGIPEPGSPCDDGDPCTTLDVIQADCTCAGTLEDEDNDGVCDAADICQGGPEPGMPCDDGDPNTTTEVVQADCSCLAIQATIICSSIENGNDDAEENANGAVSLTSSDLELVADGGLQTIGLRFNNPGIPPDVSILSAYIQFTTDEKLNTDPCNLIIQGEASDNAQIFIKSGNNISNRTLTNASVQWSPAKWETIGEAGPHQQTADISTVIQEIVNRNGYSLNNAIAIIMSGEGKRVAESFNGSSGQAAEICIEYSLSFNCPGLEANFGDSCNDGDDCTINDEIQADCSCIGILIDNDNDGQCDLNDICSGGSDPGTACDDGDECTTGDVILADCNCQGVFQDDDNDGVCDVYDNCNGPEPGTPCDDGDPNTTGETIQQDCNCWAPSSQISCSRIDHPDDDAEEVGNGGVSLRSSDLELVFEFTPQTVGLRFNNLNIPAGARIHSAHLQFAVDELNNQNPSNINIYGQASDNAARFEATVNNISNRPLTNASILWSPDIWESIGQTGPTQLTPDISSIIQEIVNTTGYTSASSIVIMMDGEGKRTAKSFNGSPSLAPELCVEFTIDQSSLIALTELNDKNILANKKESTLETKQLSGLRKTRSGSHFNYTPITIFPNPAKNRITLSFLSSDQYRSSIMISDLNGKIVRQIIREIYRGKNAIVIEELNLPNGIYFLQLISGDSILRSKFVINY